MGKALKAVGKTLGLLPEKPDKPAPPAPLPDPENPEAKLAAQKKLRQRAKGGREGTIFTGGAYGGQNLGGTA